MSEENDIQDEEEFVHCPVCAVDRDANTLKEGHCPHCNTFIDTETPATVQGPRKYRKHVRIDPNPVTTPVTNPICHDKPHNPVEEEAFKVAYEAPKPIIDSDLDREMAARMLCRRRLMPFIKRFRPKYNAGWVHEDICLRLEKFIKDVEEGKEPRVLLMMPPRAGKSEIGSRHFPAWVLGQHPEWEIIAASHTSSLTMSFSRYVRDLIRDPAYTALFPETQLDPASQSVENWNIIGGGGYLAAGVGTGITGRGAHILLLDDLVKDIEAADSDTIRDNTWEWYASTAYTRLAPGGGVLGIMTWWHDDDWAGRIQQVMESGEGDRFEIIKYPAVNDQGDEYILDGEPNRPIVQISPGTPLPTPEQKPRLTRTINTAIHPARYTTEAMHRIKRNLYAAGQQRVWNALYQQNPAPDDGLFFTKDMFRYYPTLPHRDLVHVYQAWDFAIAEGSENDYTVGTTLYQDQRDNIYVVDVRRFKSSDAFYIIDQILDYAAEYKATLLGFEDGQIWKTLQSQFDKRCSERKYYPSYEILKPLTDKMVRAHPLRGRMQAHTVFFNEKAPWYQELYHEMTRFPAGKHDDQIDALAWAIRLTLMRTAPRDRTPRPRKQKSFLDKIINTSRHGASHMAA